MEASLRGAKRRGNLVVIRAREARLPRSRWSLAMTMEHIGDMSRRAGFIAVILSLTFLGILIASSEAFVSPLQDRPAPELADTTWLNSNPLKLQGLRGKVVLIEFWTYG